MRAASLWALAMRRTPASMATQLTVISCSAGSVGDTDEPVGEEHDVVAGDGEVVEPAGASSMDRVVRVSRSGRHGDVGLGAVRRGGEEVELTGERVELGVGVQAPAGAGQVDPTPGAEVGGELVGERAVTEGEDGGSERDDVAGHDVGAGVSGSRHRFGAEHLGGGVGDDPPVPVGRCASGVEGDGVHHPRPARPFGGGCRCADRVRSDAQVPARQRGRQRPGHGKVGDGGLVGDRGVVLGEAPAVGAAGHDLSVDLRGPRPHRARPLRFGVATPGQVTPRRWATAAASTRLLTPSLRRMFDTWTLAVFSDT